MDPRNPSYSGGQAGYPSYSSGSFNPLQYQGEGNPNQYNYRTYPAPIFQQQHQQQQQPHRFIYHRLTNIILMQCPGGRYVLTALDEQTNQFYSLETQWRPAPTLGPAAPYPGRDREATLRHQHGVDQHIQFESDPRGRWAAAPPLQRTVYHGSRQLLPFPHNARHIPSYTNALAAPPVAQQRGFGGPGAWPGYVFAGNQHAAAHGVGGGQMQYNTGGVGQYNMPEAQYGGFEYVPHHVNNFLGFGAANNHENDNLPLVASTTAAFESLQVGSTNLPARRSASVAFGASSSSSSSSSEPDPEPEPEPAAAAAASPQKLRAQSTTLDETEPGSDDMVLAAEQAPLRRTLRALVAQARRVDEQLGCMGDDDKALIQWLILHEIDAKTVAWYLFKTIPRANRPFQEPQNAVPVVERIVETMRAGGPDDDTMISRLDATARSLDWQVGLRLSQEHMDEGDRRVRRARASERRTGAILAPQPAPELPEASEEMALMKNNLVALCNNQGY